MDSEIELRHLRYFVAVAEELHFGRAASRLHLAQPPLSQQIRKLEEIVGYPLFLRTTRAVKLTAAGEIFLERARRTLRSVIEDLAEARSVGRGELGALRVGFISSGMLTPLPSMLGEYRRKHPRVDLQLREGFSSEMTQALLDSLIDVAFLRDGGEVEGLEAETLSSEPFVAVLPAHHALAKSRTLSAAVLRDEPFVLFSPRAGRLAYEKTASLCEAHGFRPRVVQEAPQWFTVLRLVGAGLGVSIAPACIERIAAPDCVCIELSGTSVRSDVDLVWRKDEERAIVKAFCDLGREMLAQRHRG
ncbi:Chromosome initiation inhibitor [Acidisarcina polymorpha]|uniref:Chromosome initiation inhibitor n=1 Tax=Acidisarcina polymorpha TaxID=2211140 RepID=A0A2Z5G1U5_9BACT|nr:LysR substrate-binding domain-containing protein [Acidisarcina polymorpha]AXC13071.1 Chromosome initiation inhibitor [Acidisarcina polymorpha]